MGFALTHNRAYVTFIIPSNELPSLISWSNFLINSATSIGPFTPRQSQACN
mgnify:CR=1 FL=1